MAHVQSARHIRRREHDAIGLAPPGRLEVTVLLPDLIPAFFYGVRFVDFVHDLVKKCSDLLEGRRRG
jgi:hypothetical protein